MSTVTNMATLRIFQVMCDKFNEDRVFPNVNYVQK